MDEYKEMYDEDGDQRECSSCGYYAPVFETEIRVDFPASEKRIVYLCEICASTSISSATVEFPSQWDVNAARLMKTIGWVANKLIDEIHRA